MGSFYIMNWSQWYLTLLHHVSFQRDSVTELPSNCNLISVLVIKTKCLPVYWPTRLKIFTLDWPCIIYKFVLFLYQLDTFNFFYIYNPWFSSHVLNRSVHHQENQMLDYTSSFWHRSLGRWSVVRDRWC
jgi:hypothetical protein